MTDATRDRLHYLLGEVAASGYDAGRAATRRAVLDALGVQTVGTSEERLAKEARQRAHDKVMAELERILAEERARGPA